MQESFWPYGKGSAVAFSLDDIHPGSSLDAYEAGGDLDLGVLGRLRRLMRDRPQLRATLFVTPDWREICPFPTRRLAKAPVVNRLFYQSRVLPKGTMNLGRHNDLAEYLRDLSRHEIALHGLHHVQRGPKIPMEYERKGHRACIRSLDQGLKIMSEARIPRPVGFGPPAWAAPKPLLKALDARGFKYLSASRDIDSDVDLRARNRGSGLKGVNTFLPSAIEGTDLVHVPINFQATSSFDRAFRILEAGGLLSIKAHAIEDACGHIALDSLNDSYVDFLSRLMEEIQSRFGDSPWFATFHEIESAWRKSR